MTDYSKWKVTELKAELKRRGVPQTGLKLKQDIVDKLTQLDSELQEEPTSQENVPEPSTDERKNEEAKEKTPQVDETAGSQQSVTESLHTEKELSPPKVDQDQVALDTQPVANPDNAARDGNQVDKVDEPSPIEHTPTRPTEPTFAAKEIEADNSQQIVDVENKEKDEARILEVPAEAPVTTDPSVSAPSEAESEMRKRKRRSQSPPPSADTIKKPKVDNRTPQVILQEDVVPERRDEQGDQLPVTRPEASEQAQIEVETFDKKDQYPERLSQSITSERINAPLERPDHRFKDLVSDKKKRKRTPSPEQLAPEDEAPVEAALHAATSAVYIRDLMRPLQPTSLKNHLISLASSPEHGSDANVLLEFFLDPIKTHCFALFRSVSAASKVRSRIHGAVWPNERDRKPLWADFIPEDKFSEWVKTEQDLASQSRGSSTRWEVVYERTDNGFEAFLQESRGTSSAPAPKTTAPRQSHDLGSKREALPSAPQSQQQAGEGFKALDERFLSTHTKPKIYYLPVSQDILERRLNQFAKISRRGSQQHHQPGGDDMRRITFEDVDVFVDGGPEYSGARNRGGRRPGRGSWRGRAR
ncbi:hypothetical protein BGW36DRAFT_356604 [Talaromyces proteolyticus]|uniref:SAP domain-containing protein n=1 Tax=Talaromyces proteolyticus TaxID=1131652 RepID=A0AAD4PZD4_9EURO|nr:uncharacterized protein BGW36DRAFT_356604 [Talaromyces proteolyticus]KAH8702485.1 hypothetical protein BGW36DRAFT_356604 [Talaromyces proteolyticus]